MRYWWVNQNQTYQHEVPGGYLWSPVKNSDGGKNPFYDNMLVIRPGDLVFSFAGTYIKAIGVATSVAEPSVKPDFGTAGSNWSDYGWLVQVEFVELSRPLRPKSHMDQIAPNLPEKYSPIRADGNGNQGVYLAEVPATMAAVLQDLIGQQVALEFSFQCGTDTFSEIERDLESLVGKTDIPEYTKSQLVKARVGQGLFRNNVRLNEQSCRITGVTQLHHLRASHIKPWRKSSNEEKLHGCNGLLLAPHVDHLFDRGFVSFEDNGDLIVSPQLEAGVLDGWSISTPQNVGKFNIDQRFFLRHHREHEFLP